MSTYRQKRVKIRQVYPPKNFLSQISLKVSEIIVLVNSFNSPKRTSLVRRVSSIQGLEFSTFYRARSYSINRNFYKSYPKSKKNKLFELHFLILNIFLSVSLSAAVNFLSKVMFKKKLYFFPLKWAMVESGAKEIDGDI